MNVTGIRSFPLANKMPLEVGVIHLVGIGGIGMSGIARVLHNLGYTVQGSDMAESASVQGLRDRGITVHIGHKAEHVDNAAVLVISSAVKADNVEVQAARKRYIPVVKRSEMLAELMRFKTAVAIAGTHGKTTTTTFTAALFEAAGLDPTVINGGIINALGTNARLGASDWMVVEADESDGTFIKLPATIGVITSLDPEHLDYYGDFATLKAAFRQFIDNLPFYGFAMLCIDHPEVQALLADIRDRRVLTYGLNPQADIRAVNVHTEVDGSICDVELSARFKGGAQRIDRLRIPMPGEHNIRNALAALGVAMELALPKEKVLQGFQNFKGVKRRFTKTGEVGGITVIDDYAHHPAEIRATLQAARQAIQGRQGRVIAVAQPHRFSRLEDLYEDFCRCFNAADIVIISDVYAAGETPIPGVDRDWLLRGLQENGHRGTRALESPEALPDLIAEIAEPGDLVVCMGAGSITQWANALPQQLEAVVGKKKQAVG